MTDFWTRIVQVAAVTANNVGNKLMEDFGRVHASEKSDGSLVTESDRWADQTIRETIAALFPDHGVLSEEGEHTCPNTDWCWVVDPLDGTTNFARGIPLWGISLGLLYQGTPVFGYVYLPPIGQAFHGFWPGPGSNNNPPPFPVPKGAFLNNVPICTNPANPSKNQFFNLCARSTFLLNQEFPCKIRLLGVASYNLLTVAAGIALGGVEATPKLWDITAAWVITQAAGAIWVPLNSGHKDLLQRLPQLVALDRFRAIFTTNSIFPLDVNQDYGTQVYPTLVVSRAELLPTFLPLVEELRKKSLSVTSASNR